MKQEISGYDKKSRVKSINCVFLLTTISFFFIGQIIIAMFQGFDNSNVLQLLTSQIILILPSVIYIVVNKIKLADAIRFKKMRISSIILVILLSYLITPLMSFINAISMLFVKNTTTSFIGDIVEGNKYLLSLFIIALIPAIFEEAVYRGIFYNEYRKVNPLKAIILSAFLFGIMHGNFNQFAYAFAMGVVFALVIEATDSVLSTMIIHFFINGTSVTTLYLYPKIMELLNKILEKSGDTPNVNLEEYLAEIGGSMEEVLTFSTIMETLFLPMLIFTALAILVYILLAKKNGRWEHIKRIFKKSSEEEKIKREDAKTGEFGSGSIGYKNKEGLMSACLIVGVLICIGIMVWIELIPYITKG